MKIVYLIALLLLSGCGYSSKGNSLVGQVKGLDYKTPVFCGDRTDVYISLGVMRNGVGSMSTHDITLVVLNKADEKKLLDSATNGALVRVKHNTKRLAFCQPLDEVTDVEIIK